MSRQRLNARTCERVVAESPLNFPFEGSTMLLRPTIWRLGGTPRPTVYTSDRATRRGKAVLDVGVKASYP